MRFLKILQRRLRALFRKRVQERELDDELRFHLESHIEQSVARGMPPAAAREAALREFGGVAQIEEECRDQRGIRLVETLVRDASYALRVLHKSPGFTAVAVLSLALGIGANTAIFTLIDAVLLKNLPVKNPRQLVQLSRSNLEADNMPAFPYPFYRQLRDHNEVFSDVICWSGVNTSLRLENRTERIDGALVSGNYFDALGVQPQLGRLLSPEDDRSGAAPAVVLSNGFWQRQFGGDPAVVGRTILLGNASAAVVGIAPPRFQGLSRNGSPLLWAPMAAMEQLTLSSNLESQGFFWLKIVGRLKPGLTPEQAQAAVQPVVYGYIEKHFPKETEYDRRRLASERAVVLPAGRGVDNLAEQFSTPLTLLMAAVGVVLLITCVNLANLLIARGAARQREIAVRLAIGAGRGRIIRQLLTESFLLAGAGALAGVAAAYWMLQALVSYLSASPLDVAPDWRVLGFLLLVSALTGMLFGLSPAMQVSRPNLSQALKTDSLTAGGGRATWRRWAVSLQIALALPLLMCAGLFLRTLLNLYTQDMGFERENLVEMTLNPGLDGYPGEQAKPFLRRLTEHVTALPGVRSAAIGHLAVLGDNAWGSGIKVEGRAQLEGDMGPLRDAVGAGYFHTLGTPIVRGRDFEASDSAAAPKVAIINESFAKFYFGSANPLGKRISAGGDKDKPDTEIVGVVKDSKYSAVREKTPRFWYVPYEQLDLDENPAWLTKVTLHVRTAGDTGATVAALRDAVWIIDKRVAIEGVTTLESKVEDHLNVERLVTTLLSFFGLLAVLLAAVGLYGVLAFTTARRRREIGVRLALGAEPRRVRLLVLRGAMLQALAGIAIGLPAGIAVSHLIASQLFAVAPTDPATMVAATILLFVVALLAGYLPARRASQVNPAIVLRCDG